MDWCSSSAVMHFNFRSKSSMTCCLSIVYHRGKSLRRLLLQGDQEQHRSLYLITLPTFSYMAAFLCKLRGKNDKNPHYVYLTRELVGQSEQHPSRVIFKFVHQWLSIIMYAKNPFSKAIVDLVETKCTILLKKASEGYHQENLQKNSTCWECDAELINYYVICQVLGTMHWSYSHSLHMYLV